MQNPRSSSTYSINFPKMIPLSQVSLYYALSTFKFRSPTRTYLKTTEIKQRQLLHKNLSTKLLTQVNKGNHQHSKTLTKLTRRTSSYINDKTQQLCETLKFKTHNEHYNKEQLIELLQDLLKEENFINIEHYEFPLTNKIEFTHFKQYFINVLYYETDLTKYLQKLETLRMSHLKLLSLNQELKGFFGLNQILQQLFNDMKQEITLQQFINNYESIKDIWIDIATHILQPQDDNYKLRTQIKQYSENNKLNHVHFFNFKYLLYKVLFKQKISKRGIKKVLKIIDSWKSTIIRCENIMDIIQKNCIIIQQIDQYLMYCMVHDQKNEQYNRRGIDLILEYLYNNDHRTLKKRDLKQFQQVYQQMQKVICRINAPQILIEDFQQDLDAIFIQRLNLNNSLKEFSNQLYQIPFFMQLYEDYECDVYQLINIEIDFMLNNRTYFRKREIELIHKNMNISNEVFDLYIMRLQDILQNVPIKAIINRINNYRNWIVNEKIKTNEFY